MGCFCCGCCLSRKKRKSFPIHEKHRQTEVNKVFIRHVENIRITPPPPPMNKKTISKATMKKKPEIKCGTTKEKNSSDARVPTSKLFRKSKQMKTPSPLPMTISYDTPKKTQVSPPSSCSSSTNSDLPKQKKRPNDRSHVDSYNVSRGTSTRKRNGTQPRKRSNGSKLVLENVRKMIKDQNLQQKESARL